MTEEGSFEFTQWSDKEVVDFLKENYGLYIVKIEKCTTGWENTTIKVTSQDEKSFIFRVTEDDMRKDDSFIKFEVDCLDFLSSFDLPVPKIIPTLGKELTGLAKGKICTLTTCMEGRHYQVAERTKLSEEKRIQFVLEISKFLGNLHKLTSGIDFKIEFPSRRDLFSYKELKKICQNRLEKMDKTFDSINLKDRLENIWNSNELFKNFDELEDNLLKGLIHTDLHDTNTLFIERNDSIILSGAIDWDDCIYGKFLYDLAIGITFWCGNRGEKVQYNFEDFKVSSYHLNPKFIQTYLQNYQSSRGFNLTKEEKGLIREYIVYAIINQIAFLILNLNDYQGNLRLEIGNELLCYGEDMLKLNWDDLMKNE